jgi:hypothetical protein
VLQSEVLVGKLLGAPDGPRACAVAIDEVAALDHESFDLAVLVQIKGAAK